MATIRPPPILPASQEVCSNLQHTAETSCPHPNLPACWDPSRAISNGLWHVLSELPPPGLHLYLQSWIRVPQPHPTALPASQEACSNPGHPGQPTPETDGERQAQKYNQQKLTQYGTIRSQLLLQQPLDALTHLKSKTVTLHPSL